MYNSYQPQDILMTQTIRLRGSNDGQLHRRILWSAAILVMLAIVCAPAL